MQYWYEVIEPVGGPYFVVKIAQANPRNAKVISGPHADYDSALRDAERRRARRDNLPAPPSKES